MPIEIRELIIRAVAMPEQEETGNLSDEEQLQPARDPQVEQEAIIQECVRQILNILRKEKER